jgi:peptidoglycan/LPS O-acetylase OafA/YrhL
MPGPDGTRTTARPAPTSGAPDDQLRRTGGVRFPLVDSLRAIAALFVVVFHVAGLAHPPHAVALFTNRLSLGVTLFFVISGFLLYRPLVAARFTRGRRPLGTGRYAWHRFLRIVPAYFVALTLIGLWFDNHAVFGPDAIVYYGFGQVYSSRTILGGIGQAWTLSIEVAFYVFLPFWAWAVARIPARTANRRVRVELIALLLLAGFSLAYKPVVDGATGIDSRLSFALINALPRYLDQFAVGMALAVVSVWSQTHRTPRAVKVIEDHPWIPWGVAAIALSVLATQVGSQTTEFVHATELGSLEVHYLNTLVALGLFLPAVFGTPGRGFVRRLLGTPALIWIGTVSYGLYLWHLAVLQQVANWGIPGDIGVSTGLGGMFVWGFFCLVPALALAAASWYGIERPLLRHKDSPPPVWLKRLMQVGRSDWANPARLGAFGLGAILTWMVASSVLSPPARQSASPVASARPPSGSGQGWVYIVATYDSRTLRLYQDARLIASVDAAGEPGPTSAPIEIGNLVGTARWTGPIQYVAVYRSALTPKQIHAHYDEGLTGWSHFQTALRTVPSPVYLWRDRLPVAGWLAPAHPPPSPRYSLEAWVRADDTDNRVVVYQLHAWFLQTDLLGHWRAGLFVRGREIDAATNIGPPHASLSP